MPGRGAEKAPGRGGGAGPARDEPPRRQHCRPRAGTAGEGSELRQPAGSPARGGGCDVGLKPSATASCLRFTWLRCSRGSVPQSRASAAIRFPNDRGLSVEPGKDVARCNRSKWSFKIKMLPSLLEIVECETPRSIV